MSACCSWWFFSRLQVAPVVVTGADNGVVSVYSLAAMVDAFGDGGGREEQRQRLEAALQVHTSQQLCD